MLLSIEERCKGGVTDKYYLYWPWHIAIGHLLDHWTRDPADSVLFLLTQPHRAGYFPGRARRGSPRKCGWTMYNLIDPSIQFSSIPISNNPARPAITPKQCMLHALPSAPLADPAFRLLLTRGQATMCHSPPGISIRNSAKHNSMFTQTRDRSR